MYPSCLHNYLERSGFEAWGDLCKRLQVAGVYFSRRKNCQGIYEQIFRMYSQEHRAYHNLVHIGHVLSEFDDVRAYAIHPNAVEFSLWFHDIFYDTKARDNEERSALFACQTARRLKLPDGFGGYVVDLIVATKHSVVPVSVDAKVVIDCDLAILGKSESEYEEYAQNIRKEYAWVPKDVFCDNRGRVLKRFLERSSIYSTDFFRNKYEDRARENLRREHGVLLRCFFKPEW